MSASPQVIHSVTPPSDTGASYWAGYEAVLLDDPLSTYDGTFSWAEGFCRAQRTFALLPVLTA